MNFLFLQEVLLNGNTWREIKKREAYKIQTPNFICIQKYIIMGKAYDYFQLYIINYKYFIKAL